MFQWIQRLRDAERNPVAADVNAPQLVQCVVLFPDHTAAVVERVPVRNITASLWGVEAGVDKDMLHPLDLDHRVLAQSEHQDNPFQVRQGVYMVYNCHRTNPYEHNIAATRILADRGGLELGCVPSTWSVDDPQIKTVEQFYHRVLKHCLGLCPKGPVVFILADITAASGPVPLPFSISYFNRVFPMLFRTDNPYNRMLREHPLFATANRSIETLLTLNGSTAQGHYRYSSRTAAVNCRNGLLRDVCGHSEERIRTLTKTQLDEIELNATICVLVYEFTMTRWQNASRSPSVR